MSYCACMNCRNIPTHRIDGWAEFNQDSGFVYIKVCKQCYNTLLKLSELNEDSFDYIVNQLTGLIYITEFSGELKQ